VISKISCFLLDVNIYLSLQAHAFVINFSNRDSGANPSLRSFGSRFANPANIAAYHYCR
jgi:hypothetical protein